MKTTTATAIYDNHFTKSYSSNKMKSISNYFIHITTVRYRTGTHHTTTMDKL